MPYRIQTVQTTILHHNHTREMNCSVIEEAFSHHSSSSSQGVQAPKSLKTKPHLAKSENPSIIMSKKNKKGNNHTGSVYYSNFGLSPIFSKLVHHAKLPESQLRSNKHYSAMKQEKSVPKRLASTSPKVLT
jgi:hypothetical protein